MISFNILGSFSSIRINLELFKELFHQSAQQFWNQIHLFLPVVKAGFRYFLDATVRLLLFY